MDYKNILMLVLAILSILYSIKNKEEMTLDGIISNLIVAAKNKFLTIENEKKFNFVLAETKKEIPFPLNLLISETRIKNMINDIYQSKFKEDFWNSENNQIAIIDTVETLINSKIEPMELLTKVSEMKKEVESKGKITGFIKSNLKNGVEAGLQFEKKF